MQVCTENRASRISARHMCIRGIDIGVDGMETESGCGVFYLDHRTSISLLLTFSLLSSCHLVSSRLISSHLISSHLISSHPISSHRDENMNEKRT
jgi:hypothetical protein